MLHRSFKPAKCKTVLKLAMSRIKLLKNKKEVVYKQQKREVAQLLESGQDRTARIRVEHVIREEKTMAAYELIEIYCELIVTRLSMIETQKNCPIDLKEAITSVMFASPRCAADIPELLDIRKHFTAKYGKEFVSSAVELHPNSGVNRMLVEKLSATAPDTQTKIKVMATIAEEHNIKWEPSVGEKDEKLVDDLLSGPKTFENVNKIHVKSPVVQAAPSFQQKQDVPVNHYEQNRNSSLHSQNFASADVGTSKTMPASPHPEPRPSSKSEGRDPEHSFSGDRNDFSPGKQNWNMGFKDATSAAQAAAEAAERASMAARAAAELSSRENTRTSYSTESQKSSVSGDECQPNYAGSTLRSEDPPKTPGNNTFHGTTRGQTNEQEDEDEDDEYNLAAETAKLRSRSKESSRSASVKSSSASIADDLLVKSSQKNDRYSQMSSPKVGLVKSKSGDYSDEEAVKEKFHEVSQKQDADRTDAVDSFVKERSGKQSSGASSRSHSSTFSDHEEFKNDVGHNLLGGLGRGDKGGFDKDIISVETNFFPSPDRETPTHLSEDAYISNSISTKSYLFKDADTPEVSISHPMSNVLAESDELQRVVFDHSNGPCSESEEELELPKHNFSPKKQISPRIVTTQLDFDEINRYSVYDKFDKEKSSKSSVHETNIVGVSETPDEMKDDDFVKLSSFEDNTEPSFGVLTGGRRNKPKLPPYNPRRRSSDTSSDSDSDGFVHIQEEHTKMISTTRAKNQSKVDDTQQNSTSNGRLTSGGVSRRTRAGIADKSSHSDQMMAFLEGSGNGSSGSDNANEKASFNDLERSKPARASTKRLNEEKFQTSAFENQIWTEQASSKPTHEEKLKTSTFGKPVPEFKDRKQEERLKPSSSEKLRSREQARPKYEEEVQTHEGRLKTSAYEKPRSREQVSPKYEQEVNSPRRAIEKPRSREQVRPKYEEEVITPTREERLKTSANEEPRSREQASPKYEQEVSTPMRDDRLKACAVEKPRSREQQARVKYEQEVNSPAPKHEERLKASVLDKPSSPVSEKNERLKTSTSSEKIPERDNSIKRASHVHPKLPDFDTVSALFQSIRSNQK